MWEANACVALQWLRNHKPVVEGGSSLSIDLAISAIIQAAMSKNARERVDAVLSNDGEGKWYCISDIAKQDDPSAVRSIQPDGSCASHQKKCLQVSRKPSSGSVMLVLCRKG
ncbi:hypothetical protein F4805DRAFT_442580 [Annulohypoxylon moriforme]|nr:hypothetical protein F4805DRAFT_442580 [Annulohypoxylon moriforme]